MKARVLSGKDIRKQSKEDEMMSDEENGDLNAIKGFTNALGMKPPVWA